MQKVKVKRHSVQKIEWNIWTDKQTDRQTNDAIALPPVLMRSVIKVITVFI